MNTKIFIFMMVLSAILAACSPSPGWEVLSSNGGDSQASESLASGPAQEEDPGAAIDNDGTVYPSSPGNPEPGEITGSESGSGDDSGDSPENGTPMEWITYTDPNFGFTLQYPTIYSILTEPQTLTDIDPALVGRFRLLDSSLADGDFAELEPPNFSIEIYSNNEGVSIENWMDDNLPGGDKETVEIGTISCTRLTQQRLLAPNQFIVCEHGSNIYKFTPLGLYSDEILGSFKFGQ